MTRIAAALALASISVVGICGCTVTDAAPDSAGPTSAALAPVEVSEPTEAGDLEKARRILEAGYTSWGYWADGGRVDLTAEQLLTDSVLDVACQDVESFEAGFTPSFVASFNAANPDVHEPSWANPDLVESKVSPVIAEVLAAACPA